MGIVLYDKLITLPLHLIYDLPQPVDAGKGGCLGSIDIKWPDVMLISVRYRSSRSPWIVVLPCDVRDVRVQAQCTPAQQKGSYEHTRREIHQASTRIS